MSITFTEKEVSILSNIIEQSNERRSFLLQKDLKKFLISHFKKLKDVDETPKKVKRDIPEKKNSTEGFKITTVSNKYEYPTSVYKKETPMIAAEIAKKGIIRKNKLGSENEFTFSIKNEARTFTYSCKNNKLTANHGRK